MSRVFYKVIDSSSELYRKCNDFLKMENDLREAQKNAIRERVPEFKTYYGERGFNRIHKYTGFVFEHVYDIDSKVWTTKMVNGRMLSKPNTRTKAGRAMRDFLSSFNRTTCWDVDELLSIKVVANGESYYMTDLFKHNDCIYICVDVKWHKSFEANNKDFIEITYGEMEHAISEYNNNV